MCFKMGDGSTANFIFFSIEIEDFSMANVSSPDLLGNV